MTNVAILVLAGTESHADLGRVTNALQAAKEFDDAGDDLEIVFDGAGTQWVAELTDDDHDLNPLYEALEDHVSVCDYCAGAFDVEDAVEESDATAVDEYEGHPSVRDLVADGYEVVTY
ncbi:hypothetical protein DMJ13_09990 [halophilic archaeon]|nr:hypothetical protein DMJ13_09990 [halophilic archaeon]